MINIAVKDRYTNTVNGKSLWPPVSIGFCFDESMTGFYGTMIATAF